MDRIEVHPTTAERSEEEVRESMWIEVIRQTERLYAELATSHTESERRGRELKAAKSFTDNIVRSMKNALVVADERGRITIVNEATSSLLGYSKGELAGRPIETLFVPSELKKSAIAEGIDAHRSREGLFDRESTLATKTGERIPVTFSCSPLRDEEGNLVGMVMVAQDQRRVKSLVNKAAKAVRAWQNEAAELARANEDLHRLQNHLVQSEKLAYVGKLAAGIAHEINNPLTSVLAISSYLVPKLPSDSPLREDLQVIVEETKRCKKIVEELLEFSRQREPSKSLTDVNRLVEDTLAVVEKQHFFHNTKIVRQYHVSLPGLMADSSQLKQVFMNIILNAQEAMPDRGVLTVRTTLSEDRRMVEVRFTDTGHGIHKEDLPRLFDPFFTTKGKTKGTGLGLSVSLGIVTRHGGSIEVSSTLGQGATFTVKLPVEKEA